MAAPDIREYEVSATSTKTFGRVIASARTHHMVVDGPVQNGCPGEAVTPAELFLAGIAACGVELIGVLAKARGHDLQGVDAEITGAMDRANRVRDDVNVFNTVTVRLTLRGVDEGAGGELVEAFKST